MPSTTSPMPKRSTVIVASLATVMLVAGVAVTRFTGNDSPSGHPTDPQVAAAPTPRPPVAEATPGPTLERAGLDVGFSDDEEGAVAAAVSYSTAAQRWLYSGATNTQSYTFNTPTNAAEKDQCGRVYYSSFHIGNGRSVTGTFPGACQNKPLTPQERVLEFTLFDLTSCIQTSTPPSAPCAPRSCAAGSAGSSASTPRR